MERVIASPMRPRGPSHTRAGSSCTTRPRVAIRRGVYARDSVIRAGMCERKLRLHKGRALTA
eukprot:6093005-Pleurochrysis_carterae.AAC.1